jgi:type IV secretion system protein VirD4
MMRHIARLAGVLALWTIMSSTLFVLVGRLWTTYPPPQMFWQWWNYALFSSHSETTMKLLAGSAGLPTVILSVGGIMALLRRGRAKPLLYGVTDWSTDEQTEAAGFKFWEGLRGGGIVLGRHLRRHMLLTFPGDEHVALYAPTRTGKGISFVIANLLRWAGSVICLDIKKENWKATAGARKMMGQEVFLFDPFSPTHQTARFNPFSSIDRDDRRAAFSSIQQMGNILFPDQDREDSSKFFMSAARSAWIGATALVSETPSQPLTMDRVLDLFTRPDAAQFLRDRIKLARAQGNPYTKACVQSLYDYIASSSGRTDLYDSIRKSVSTRLALWFNPVICAATEVSDFDIRLLRQKKMSIYVAVAPGDIERLSPLLSILFQQIINVTSTLPEDDPTVRHRVLMMLDEFPTLGAMPHLAKAFAFLAGFWVRIAIVLQDPPQLDGVYGHDMAKTILDNCGAEVVFGTKNQALIEQLSKRLGSDTQQVTTQTQPRFWASFQWGKQRHSVHPEKRPLMLPQEIARLPDTMELVFRRGVGPIKARKIRWYEDRIFRGLFRPAPPVAPIEVPMPLDTGETRESEGASNGRTRNLRDNEQQLALSR